MDKLVISGGRELHGHVTVSGAKNAALPILCAALLTDEELVLDNVPRLHDVTTMLRLLARIGVTVEQDGHRVRLRTSGATSPEAPYDLVKTMRASILVLGPLVARFGEARVSLPGGCAIGQRPVDQHIKGLQAMGAETRIEHGYVLAQARRLKGTRLATDMVTVTGTENLMMAASLAKGRTVIENAACEPEVVDLANLLNAMGARITGVGTTTLTIDGVDRLHGAQHRVMADRIEAGTFLCAAAATGGSIELRGVEPRAMRATLDLLRQAGARLEIGEDTLRLSMNERPQAVSAHTAPYPGFATDMQAQLMALNTVARGSATIVETIFENRFMHVLEMQRLGADITIEGRRAIIHGVEQLSGAAVMATDLRASAGLVIAGLVASGRTVVDRIYHLDRGYEQMEVKLAELGAAIERSRG